MMRLEDDPASFGLGRGFLHFSGGKPWSYDDFPSRQMVETFPLRSLEVGGKHHNFISRFTDSDCVGQFDVSFQLNTM